MQLSTPKRVSHSYVQDINGSPEEIFPLYCPVRETEWAPGWDPVSVFSNSGIVEKDCIFVTSDKDLESIWVVTVHDPEAWHVEMIKVTPGVTVCKLEIQLIPVDRSHTQAKVTYSYTSLGEAGDRFLEGFTEAYYKGFMVDWEQAMNHYLKIGQMVE